MDNIIEKIETEMVENLPQNIQNLEDDDEKKVQKELEKLPKVAKKILKKVATKKSENYKRGSLGKAIYAYFDKVEVDNANYEVSLKLAKTIMPTTKYAKTHFSWYKNKYRELLEEKAKVSNKKK
jgi:hypothetical protein